jgi:hypothetical protein
LEAEAFELAIELMKDWRLDRYYAARIKLFDVVLNEIPDHPDRSGGRNNRLGTRLWRGSRSGSPYRRLPCATLSDTSSSSVLFRIWPRRRHRYRQLTALQTGRTPALVAFRSGFAASRVLGAFGRPPML